MPLIKCCVIAYFVDSVCYKNSKFTVLISQKFTTVFVSVVENIFAMFSLISSNKATLKRVAITAAWSSNLGMLVLLFAGTKRDFGNIKLHFTVSCFLQRKKATVPKKGYRTECWI